MRETTKALKSEAKADIIKIYQHNNSKSRKRTPEQNEQARADKANYFTAKWTKKLEQAETPAQRNYCEDVLGRIQYIR